MGNLALDDLLGTVQARSGVESLTQEWLDSIVPEMMSYLLAIPARCRRGEWLTWDDLPGTVQAILVGVLARHANSGLSNVVAEAIGDYSVKYSDPALFEGRIPRWFTDGEELALSRLAGCGGGLYSVMVPGMGVFDYSVPEQIEVNRSTEAL